MFSSGAAPEVCPEKTVCSDDQTYSGATNTCTDPPCNSYWFQRYDKVTKECVVVRCLPPSSIHMCLNPFSITDDGTSGERSVYSACVWGNRYLFERSTEAVL